MTVSTSNLLRWADLFVADFSTQALKTFTWIIGFPVFIANSGFQYTNPFSNQNPESIIFLIYKIIGHPFVMILCFMGLYIVLFKSFLQSRREGFAITFLLLFLSTYPAIQFNLRHFFYLEFIWVLCFISVFSLPTMISKYKKEIIKFFYYIFGMAIFISSSYFALIQYQ
jgi:hypothetical protein